MAELISVTLTDGKKTEIVNLDHITRIQPMDGSSVIIMTDGTTIAVRGIEGNGSGPVRERAAHILHRCTVAPISVVSKHGRLPSVSHLVEDIADVDGNLSQPAQRD